MARRAGSSSGQTGRARSPSSCRTGRNGAYRRRRCTCALFTHPMVGPVQIRRPAPFLPAPTCGSPARRDLGFHLQRRICLHGTLLPAGLPSAPARTPRCRQTAATDATVPTLSGQVLSVSWRRMSGGRPSANRVRVAEGLQSAFACRRSCPSRMYFSQSPRPWCGPKRTFLCAKTSVRVRAIPETSAWVLISQTAA